MGGIHIKDKEVIDMIKKIDDLKQKDEVLYKKKVDQLKNTIGKDKVDKKLKEFDKKYGNQLNDSINKISEFKKTASNEEVAQLILDMKDKLSKEDQKKFDKFLNMAKNYMKDI